ncbi:hypothetical protein [uncultured Anaerococcus sp.]|uniref:hypothetical protein n=1 Tax=uncultured Anaerococcus sp. TaxID=293428 RepID=UPI00262A3796|nr:hypothetical protein [uncultured Anaerococcus sp.]
MDKYRFNLEVGKAYKVEPKKKDKRKINMCAVDSGIYKAKLIEVNNRIAIFDDGLYKKSEMIKDYRIGWIAS